MSLDLDSLKSEVLEHLEREGFVVFHGYSRLADSDSFVAWDCERQPEYQAFLNTAKKAGVRMIVYHYREFTPAHLDEITDRLEEAELPPDVQRQFERRVRELRGYEGFTCALELSFDYEGRIYMFNVRAEWYEDYLDAIEELDAIMPEADENDESSLGGYYSSN